MLRNQGPLYPSQVTCLPLSLLRHDLDIWKASPKNLYDKLGPRHAKGTRTI